MHVRQAHDLLPELAFFVVQLARDVEANMAEPPQSGHRAPPGYEFGRIVPVVRDPDKGLSGMSRYAGIRPDEPHRSPLRACRGVARACSAPDGCLRAGRAF